MERALIYSDATELAKLIRIGEVTSVQIITAHLARIAAVDSRINSIVTINENALNDAKAADEMVKDGKPLGLLHGVPFTVKDSIDTARVPTQRGSPIFKGRIPDVDAVCVARLKAAGAILLAKTNLPEFSYSTESVNLLSGRVNNPWNLDKTPGGSSGGESAAIAAGLSPLGLGTDLAISIRGPAAQTGIMGLKATHGRVPMTGIWPRAPRRFWHVGPMARSVRDLALAHSILAGPDGQDGFSSFLGLSSSSTAIASDNPLRVGWLVEPGFGPIHSQVHATVQAAADTLGKAGCKVESVRIPALEEDSALDIFLLIHVNEMKPAFAEATHNRPDSEISYIARNMLESPETPAKEYVSAEQAADRLKDGFAEYFANYDALLCPVLPIAAHEHDMKKYNVNGKSMDAIRVMAATVPFNVTGLPAISIPFGKSEEGLPTSVQLVGSWAAEPTILHLASLLEGQSPVKNQLPQI